MCGLKHFKIGGRLDQTTFNRATVTPNNLETLIWIIYVGDWLQAIEL